MTIQTTPFIRNTLLADAAMGAGAAALTILASGPLSTLLNLPASLIFWAGVALLPIVAFLLLMAVRNDIPRNWLREIVFINWAWVVASFGILLFAPIQPNLLGVAFIVAQAVAVGVFAYMQALPLRQTSARVA